MISKVILLSITFVYLVNSVCKNPAQSQGQCTQCGPVDILISKNCYPKIRGCMVHIAGPKCTQCQFGYVLYQQTCIRQAVWDEMQNKKPPNITDIPPVVIGTPTLTLEQIQLQVGDQYGGYFTDAHQLFLNRHTELGKGNIKSVDKLETKKGVYFVTVYEGENGQKYEATAFVDSFNTVKQVSFVTLDTQRKDPFTADTQLRQIQGANLTGYNLFEARVAGDKYLFDYMNPALAVVRIEFNKNDIGPLLSTKINVKKINATDLAKEEMISKYPLMGTQKVSRILRYEDFHIFVMTPNYTCSVRFFNNVFLSNKPVTIKNNTFFLDSLELVYNWFGFYTLFAWMDPRCYACLDVAKAAIPQISAYMTTNVQTQTMSLGTMFKIEMSKIFYPDSFKVVSIYMKQGYAKLAEIWKNGVLVYTENYNYNYDANFFKWYLMAMSTSRVLNVPAIDNVTIKFSSPMRYYKVNYVPTEYMEFAYNSSSGISKLITYTVQGQNIVPILNKVGPSTQKKQPQVLFEYLIKKDYTNPFSFLQSFFDNTFGIVLTWVTIDGTYKASLKQGDRSYIVNGVQQISDKTCCDVNNWSSNKKFKSIDSFLRSNYNLNGLNIALAQNKVNGIGNRYRLLYSNPKLRQIQFIVEQLYTLFNVIKSTSLNGGYSIVDPLTTNPDYSRLLSYLSKSNITGNNIPILTQNNTNTIRGYCNDGQATQQIVITRSTGAAKVNNIANRQLLLVPQGFSLSNLIIPGQPAPEDQDYIQLFQMEAQTKHPQLGGATLVFADKQNNNYNLMYKTLPGNYVKLTCSMDDQMMIHIGDMEITDYKDTDFTTCTQLSKAGTCLSCQSPQLEYQGSCWDKIEGCLAQAGSLCLRCAGEYALQGKVCKKACTDLI